jgi:UrcA family protein
MKNLITTQSGMAKFMVVAGFFALGCTAIGGTALAQQPSATEAPPASQSVSYPVRYSDLDVSKMNGAKTLYLRIRYAAETLCEGAATWGKKEGEACVHKAIDDAVARVDAPLLTQYSQLRSKGDKAGLVQLAKGN